MPDPTTWIVVPTYWTFAKDQPGEERVIFDHPTPLDEEGTLPRLLESVVKLDGRFAVLIVAAATHPSLGEALHRRLAGLLSPFAGRLPLYLASPVNLPKLNACLPEPILKLDSYGNIRNVQLIVPYAAGAKAVIAIDDDEIIPDRDFLSKPEAWLGKPCGGAVVGGIAGPYFDARGDYHVGGAEDLSACDNVFLKKNFYMDQALTKVMSAPASTPLVRSNVGFGGNTAFDRAIIAKVCHDPFIPRGEDYDYIINAAMQGIAFFFQPSQRIVHLPPDSTVGSQAGDKMSKLLADIRRFIYMRTKIEHFEREILRRPWDTSFLYPYPGPYLDKAVSLPQQAVAAIDGKYPQYRAGGGSPEAFVADAVATAQRKAPEFFEYGTKWQAALASLTRTAGMRDAVPGLRLGQ